MLYLAPWEGSGSWRAKDPFRPSGTSGFGGWGALDMRVDPSRAGGFSLVEIPDTTADFPGVIKLGESPDELTAAVVKTRLSNALGLNLGSMTTLSDVVAEMFLKADKPWPFVVPDPLGCKRIYIAGREWAFKQVPPPIRGLLVDPTDNFTRGDETPIGGNWTTGWSGGGSLRLVSNQLAGPAADADSAAYLNSFTPQNDQFVEATLAAHPGANDWGPAWRIQTGAFSFYWATPIGGSPGWLKMVAGAASFLFSATSNSATANGQVVRVDATGSNATVKTDALTWGSFPHTDPTFTSGRTGVFIFANDVRISLFTSGDLGVVVQPSGVRWGVAPQQRMR